MNKKPVRYSIIWNIIGFLILIGLVVRLTLLAISFEPDANYEIPKMFIPSIILVLFGGIGFIIIGSTTEKKYKRQIAEWCWKHRKKQIETVKVETIDGREVAKYDNLPLYKDSEVTFLITQIGKPQEYRLTRTRASKSGQLLLEMAETDYADEEIYEDETETEKPQNNPSNSVDVIWIIIGLLLLLLGIYTLTHGITFEMTGQIEITDIKFK